MSWFSRLKESLVKTSGKLKSGIDHIFFHKKLDDEAIEEFEELLIASDLGVITTNEIINELRKQKFNKEVSGEEIKDFLKEKLLKKFSIHKDLTPQGEGLKIILICGVNGNGKTTSISKLANFYQEKGKKIMFAACDTFRAGAAEQLAVWAERLGIMIHSEVGKDPASVAFNAVTIAKDHSIDILLIDTAGRLHNKANLMDELAKIYRVTGKALPGAPHEVFLVLDATTGQDALIQVQKFAEIVPLSGLIVTKLDGTAKAGIVVAIADKFKLPIVAIGIGEKEDDLRPFNSHEFVESMLD